MSNSQQAGDYQETPLEAAAFNLRGEMEAVWRVNFPNGRLPDHLAAQPLAVLHEFLRTIAQASKPNSASGGDDDDEER